MFFVYTWDFACCKWIWIHTIHGNKISTVEKVLRTNVFFSHVCKHKSWVRYEHAILYINLLYMLEQWNSQPVRDLVDKSKIKQHSSNMKIALVARLVQKIQKTRETTTLQKRATGHLFKSTFLCGKFTYLCVALMKLFSKWCFWALSSLPNFPNHDSP